MLMLPPPAAGPGQQTSWS